MRSSTGIKRFAVLLVGGLFAAFAMAAHSGSAVTPGSKAASEEACVAPTAEMRRNHMDYLQHDRHASVRKGIRDIKNSLSGCVDCHASKDNQGNYKPVNAEGEFCEACHNYTAVNVACFQCHRKTPQEMNSSAKATGGSKFGLLLDDGETAAFSNEELKQLHAKVLED
ncbi:MAG: sulfur reduction protein DsrJ [Candidatus Sedimenticola sp. 20ELBAFRAG]